MPPCPGNRSAGSFSSGFQFPFIHAVSLASGAVKKNAAEREGVHGAWLAWGTLYGLRATAQPGTGCKRKTTERSGTCRLFGARHEGVDRCLSPVVSTFCNQQNSTLSTINNLVYAG